MISIMMRNSIENSLWIKERVKVTIVQHMKYPLNSVIK